MPFRCVCDGRERKQNAYDHMVVGKIALDHVLALTRRITRRGTAWVLRPWWVVRFARFGSGSTIAFPARFFGNYSICIGREVTIWHNSRIEARRAQVGVTRILIGDRTIIHPYAHIGAVDRVSIGDDCLFASGVYITDHDHNMNDPDNVAARNGRDWVSAPVVIGDKVWIGEKACVLKGVTIGRCSIIGAGSVVTRSVPPYSIAAGVPARVIRRFDHASKKWVAADGR